MLTRLLELRRHGDLRLLEGVPLAPEPAVVIDDPVAAIGTALHLDLEPTLLTVRHGRRPQRASAFSGCYLTAILLGPSLTSRIIG
jgi:hypothetical protein